MQTNDSNSQLKLEARTLLAQVGCQCQTLLPHNLG